MCGTSPFTMQSNLRRRFTIALWASPQIRKNRFYWFQADFSGIQDAIYTIASGGALKTLRARSFMLELLTEHIIYEIGQATGCGRYSLIFSGGGGFSLLVPNTDDNQKKIKDFIKIINNWMLDAVWFAVVSRRSL